MPKPMTITFLGTSGSSPTRERSLPSVALEYDGGAYLFDCGEGTQRQLMAYSISPSRVKAIFITHMHGDHVIGVAGLIRTLALNKRTDPLYICVPNGEEGKLQPLIDFDRAIIGYEIRVVPVRSGKVMDGRGFSVNAFKLRHSVPTYGYAFAESDRLRFMKDRCRALGIKGTMFSELEKKGRLRVGKRTVTLRQVTTKEKGRRVVYVADTRPTKSTVEAAKGADILIHEATYEDSLRHLAKERLHSTAFEAGQVARAAGAKTRVVFHMSTRYKEANDVLKDARRAFRSTVAAHDGMRITI